MIDQIAKCSCTRRTTFLYFCIANDCDSFRRLCYQGRLKHNQTHQLIQVYDPNSLQPFSYLKNNPNQHIINQTLKIIQQCGKNMIKKMTQSLESVIKQFNNIYKDVFLHEVSILRETCEQKNQEEKLKILVSKQATKQQLAKLASQISGLKKSRFNYKQTINLMKEEIQKDCEIIYKQFNQIFEGLIKIENRLKEMTPFSKRWDYLNSNYINKIQQTQKQRKREQFVKMHGNIIGTTLSIPINCQKWLQTHKNLKQVVHLSLSTDRLTKARKNLQSIPKQVQLFPNLQYLNLSYNQITEISNLQSLTNLKQLRLYSNKIEKFEYPYYLPHLKILQLNDNKIKVTQKIRQQIQQLKDNEVDVYVG